MVRTKMVGRKGPIGKEYRDNQKRKREVAESACKDKGNFPSTFQDQDRPSKKPKPTATTLQTTCQKARSTTSAPQAQPQNVIFPSVPVAVAPVNAHAQRQIPAPHDLTRTHQTTQMSILSSSQIQKKASHVLSILSTFSFSDPTPHVVLLSAKAPVACKLISIAEIVKRELAKSGAKWFQYNVVGELSTTIPRSYTEIGKDENENEKEGEEEGDVEMKDDGEEEAFEVMKTPFERALEAEERPKIRGVATLSLYLSRVRIESLKKIYGEQTNALT
ncbi:9856a7c1-f7cf-4c93-8211-29b393709eb0 [Sclerotinia trifoliorum]|uniref:9856a7c1-f7cf-4c93-8211-29b393709eb0 n=1 Tax=Sclerotinia trifoliorum TaxID=28548 RepID=A0A8H2VNA4_9HELO|nr:9856a7c1-f7cf-4c93-8211-29b393709eb0 [Sclerotinia trifoliorum]